MLVAHSLKIAILSLLISSAKCQRLDTQMLPEHYDLILLPVVAGDRPQLCGHVTIDFKVKGTTNFLTFNSAGLRLISVAVKPVADKTNENRATRLSLVEDLCFFGLGDSSAETIQFVHSDQSGQQASVVTRQVLNPGTDYRISILYAGQVNDKETEGFFRGAYTDPHSCCQRWFGATQMEIAHARKVLPCLDEPGFKTTFKVTLGHELKTSALSNMPDVSSSAMSTTAGWAWTEFGVTPPMPTYLLAFVITEFEQTTIEYKSSDNRTVPLRFWARPGQMSLVQHLMNATPQMIHFLETYLEQPFPLPKVDFYAPPIEVRNFLAMENWGLVIFSEQRYYFDEAKESRMLGFEILQTMAHELAHQYFGNLVTSDWWSDIWLNEGFAGFFEFAIANHVLPAYRDESDKNRADGAINAHRMDESDPKGRSVVYQVSTPEEAEQNFGILSYSKGNILLRMLQYFMGHENFRKGLVAYFDKYKFQTANSTQLWDVMNKQLQKDRRVGNRLNVREIMETWTHQPSFPIVKCHRTPNGKVKLSQQRFPGKPDVPLRPWWVPVSIVNGRSADFSPKGMSARLWLTPQRTEMEVAVTVDKSIGPLDNDTWVLVNGDVTAYTRVDYDENNWRLIAQQLMDNHTRIPTMTRTKLIDDAFTFGVGGLLNFHVPLATLEYLAYVDDEHVLPTALRHLKDIKAVVTDNSTLVDLLQSYIDKVTKQAPKQNELARSGHNGNNKLTKTKCESGDKHCVTEAIHLFNSLIDHSANDAEKRFAQDEFDWLGCVAIGNGGDKEWRFAWKQTLNRDWSEWHDKIYRAMGCSKSAKRIDQLLSRALQSTVQAQDAESVVKNLAQSPARSHTVNFVMDNWSVLETLLKPTGGPMKLLESITLQSSAAKELRKIGNFFKVRNVKGKEARQAAGILENIRKNARFVASRSDDLYTVLSRLGNRKALNDTT